MRPADLEQALAAFREVFGPDVVALCGLCNENAAGPSSTWCPDCDALFAEHVAPLLEGGVLTHFGLVVGDQTPKAFSGFPEATDGRCGWCRERPVEDASRLCSECAPGSTDTTSIGVPLTDMQVRQRGYVPTSRGWVARPGSFGLRPRDRVDRLSSECPGCLHNFGRDAKRDPWRCVIHDMAPVEDDVMRRLRQAADDLRRIVGR